MGFVEGAIKSIQYNRSLQSKGRGTLMRDGTSLSGRNDLVYNEDFGKDLTEKDLLERRKKVKSEIRTESIRSFFFTVLSVLLASIMFWWLLFG